MAPRPAAVIEDAEPEGARLPRPRSADSMRLATAVAEALRRRWDDPTARDRRDAASLLLRAASWGYGSAATTWRRLRALGPPPVRLPVPVVSVGGVTVGGSGKTPLVRWLAKELLRLRRRPGIVARGYGRDDERALTLVSDGGGRSLAVSACGDELSLLADALPGVAVVASADRVAGARMAISKLHCDAILLDDGFQRRSQLRRDVDLVVLAWPRPFGNGLWLPAGPLREGVGAIRGAGAVVVLSRGRKAVPRGADIPGGVPLVRGRIAPTALAPLVFRRRSARAPRLRGVSVFVACGVAKPEGFADTVRAAGAEIAGTLFFPDHHRYSERDALRIAGEASATQARYAVVTRKDAVKLIELPVVRARPEVFADVLVVDAQVRLDSGGPLLRRLLRACVEGR